MTRPPPQCRSSEGQISDVLSEIRRRIVSNERALVTTLTKRMAEEVCVLFVHVRVGRLIV